MSIFWATPERLSSYSNMVSDEPDNDQYRWHPCAAWYWYIRHLHVIESKISSSLCNARLWLLQNQGPARSARYSWRRHDQIVALVCVPSMRCRSHMHRLRLIWVAEDCFDNDGPGWGYHAAWDGLASEVHASSSYRVGVSRWTARTRQAGNRKSRVKSSGWGDERCEPVVTLMGVLDG